jgi:hypothetical protein
MTSEQRALRRIFKDIRGVLQQSEVRERKVERMLSARRRNLNKAFVAVTARLRAKAALVNRLGITGWNVLVTQQKERKDGQPVKHDAYTLRAGVPGASRRYFSASSHKLYWFQQEDHVEEGMAAYGANLAAADTSCHRSILPSQNPQAFSWLADKGS